VLTAFGMALTVCGVVLALPLVVIGLIITLVTVRRWVRETRTEIGELPLEHG
jgi:hypothetical protein